MLEFPTPRASELPAPCGQVLVIFKRSDLWLSVSGGEERVYGLSECLQYNTCVSTWTRHGNSAGPVGTPTVEWHHIHSFGAEHTLKSAPVCSCKPLMARTFFWSFLNCVRLCCISQLGAVEPSYISHPLYQVLTYIFWLEDVSMCSQKIMGKLMGIWFKLSSGFVW